MNKLEKVYSNCVKRSFKPATNLKIWEWCEQNIHLSSLSSGTGGQYSLDNYSYLKEIYDSCENQDVRKIVIKKSVQSGLTTLSQNLILFYVANRNLPLCYFTATGDLAKEFSKQKLIPTLENCDAIKEFRTGNVDKETLTFFEFKNCNLKLGWAGSVNSLASFPAALIICDEISKWPDSRTEARAVDLALARSITFPLNKKQILISTPAEESSCQISKAYKEGDERIFEIPSPTTGIFFEITIDLLKKPDDYQDEDGNYDWQKIKRGTYLEDPTTREFQSDGLTIKAAGKRIYEHEKASLVRKGKWRATNLSPKDPECHSYQVTALYSMDVSFGELLQRYIQSLDDIEKLKELRTQYLGQSWTQINASIQVEEIDRLIKASPYYPLGVVPEYLGCGMLLGAVDQQLNHFIYTVQALCESGNSYVIDYGTVLTFDDLIKLGKKTYMSMDGKEEYGNCKFLIDEGGFSVTDMRDFSLRTGFQFICSKGVAKAYGQPYKDGQMEHPAGSDQFIPYVTINDNEMKKILLLNTIKNMNGDLYLPHNLCEDFKKQLTAEQYVKNSKGEFEWKKRGQKNHYLDTMKMIEALKDYNRRRLPINIVEINLTND